MSTHIPGPWTALRSRHGGYSVECNGRRTYPASKAVCTVHPYPRTPEAHGEAEATAGLISAAPDLLAVARIFERYLADNGGDEQFHNADGTGWLTIARSAIAKAEGQS